MFDLAWSEIAVIAIVALVVIGPKDLPKVLRTVGAWVRRARVVAREFQISIDQMVRDAELEELRQKVNETASVNPNTVINKAIDPSGEMAAELSRPAGELPLPGSVSSNSSIPDTTRQPMAGQATALAPFETSLQPAEHGHSDHDGEPQNVRR